MILLAGTSFGNLGSIPDDGSKFELRIDVDSGNRSEKNTEWRVRSFTN